MRWLIWLMAGLWHRHTVSLHGWAKPANARKGAVKKATAGPTREAKMGTVQALRELDSKTLLARRGNLVCYVRYTTDGGGESYREPVGIFSIIPLNIDDAATLSACNAKWGRARLCCAAEVLLLLASLPVLSLPVERGQQQQLAAVSAPSGEARRHQAPKFGARFVLIPT